MASKPTKQLYEPNTRPAPSYIEADSYHPPFISHLPARNTSVSNSAGMKPALVFATPPAGSAP